jgi:hypothetical protein
MYSRGVIAQRQSVVLGQSRQYLAVAVVKANEAACELYMASHCKSISSCSAPASLPRLRSAIGTPAAADRVFPPQRRDTQEKSNNLKGIFLSNQ